MRNPAKNEKSKKEKTNYKQKLSNLRKLFGYIMLHYNYLNHNATQHRACE
jgi:hypothetical protein